MTLKELVEGCENVDDYTRVTVYNSLEDYEWNTANWDAIGIETARKLDWRIAKFRVSLYSNRLIVALA